MVRNRAFERDDGEIRNGRDADEVSTVKSISSVDGNQLTKLGERLAGMNLNDYATRKTLAQGMLDLALLTANAAQLKRVLTIGDSNRFYVLLVTLITISLCLQVVQAALMCILAIVFDLNKVEEHRRTNIANNVLLMTTIVSVAVNIVISTFDIADIK